MRVAPVSPPPPRRSCRREPQGRASDVVATVRPLMETASFGGSVQRFEEQHAPSFAGIFRFDPLLLLGGAGLVACSVYVLSAATENDIPGNPHYYVVRQAAYGVVGILLMLL